MNIIVNISKTECENLRNVEKDFEEQEGFWFTILKNRPRRLKAQDYIYVYSEGRVRARGRVREVGKIGTDQVSSIGWPGGQNRSLWRREDDWLVVYVGLRWYAEPVEYRMESVFRYMTRFRHMRIFKDGEPQLEK